MLFTDRFMSEHALRESVLPFSAFMIEDVFVFDRDANGGEGEYVWEDGSVVPILVTRLHDESGEVRHATVEKKGGTHMAQTAHVYATEGDAMGALLAHRAARLLKLADFVDAQSKVDGASDVLRAKAAEWMALRTQPSEHSQAVFLSNKT